MGFINKSLIIVISSVSSISTLLTFINFTKFLSDFNFSNLTSAIGLPNDEIGFKVSADDDGSHATRALLIDTALLSIFMIQHSSLILPCQDIISNSLALPILNRILFNLFTSLSLQMLMWFWKPIPQYCLWNLDYESQTRPFEVIVGIHIMCWILIYMMTIIMDITDLLGIKQVYFHLTGRSTSTIHSQNLKSFYSKMRHPSLLGFTVIFWIYPCMRLDRLVLALAWSLYMLIAWQPNTLSYNYIIQQQAGKKSTVFS